MSDDHDQGEEKRQQVLKIPVPWSSQPIEVRGFTVFLAILLVVTGVDAWSGWLQLEQLKALGDNVITQTRAINMQSCMSAETDASKRRERYEECLRWFSNK